MDPVIERLAADTRLVAREQLRWHVDRARLELGMLEPLPLPEGREFVKQFGKRLRRTDPEPKPTPGVTVFPCTCDGTLHMHMAIDPIKIGDTP